MSDEGFLLSAATVAKLERVILRVLGRSGALTPRRQRTYEEPLIWHGVLKTTITAASGPVSDPAATAGQATVQLYQVDPNSTASPKKTIISTAYPTPITVINRDSSLSGGIVDQTYVRCKIVDDEWVFDWTGC